MLINNILITKWLILHIIKKLHNRKEWVFNRNCDIKNIEAI